MYTLKFQTSDKGYVIPRRLDFIDLAIVLRILNSLNIKLYKVLIVRPPMSFDLGKNKRDHIPSIMVLHEVWTRPKAISSISHAVHLVFTIWPLSLSVDFSWLQVLTSGKTEGIIQYQWSISSSIKSIKLVLLCCSQDPLLMSDDFWPRPENNRHYLLTIPNSHIRWELNRNLCHKIMLCTKSLVFASDDNWLRPKVIA